MSKALIIYFSHTKQNYINGSIQELVVGNTAVVAKKIQEIKQGDIFEIVPLHEYPFDYHECTKIAKKELQNNSRPKYTNVISHIEKYDTIYLGFPNWWGTMPMCVWTFLENYGLSNKVIYPFCTHEGSHFGNSLSDLQKLCPNSIIKNGLTIYGSQVQNSDKKIKEWLKEE